MTNLDRRYYRKGEFVLREVDGDTLLIPINNDTVDLDAAYIMSETADFIFDLLDGNHTLSEIIDQLIEEFEVSREDAEKDVLEFIGEIRDDFLEL